MKLAAPQGMTGGGVDVGGQHVAVDSNGLCEVPDDFDPQLLQGIGFTIVPADDAPPQQQD